jgi:hypothetical protein
MPAAKYVLLGLTLVLVCAITRMALLWPQMSNSWPTVAAVGMSIILVIACALSKRMLDGGSIVTVGY